MAQDIPAPVDLLQLLKDCKLLEMLKCVAQFVPYAGAVAEKFLPDEKHNSIIRWFEKLSQQLDKDKRELENIIKIESLYVRYGPYIVTIQTEISLWADILRARDEIECSRYIQRFKEFCADQKHTLALNNLFEGLSGRGTLQINIMNRYYTYTKGHLRRIESLARELLLLVCGAFMATRLYETLMHDQRFAEEILSKYTDRIDDVYENIEAVVDRCKNEFRENMMRDLNEILDSNVSNSEAVISLRSLMSEKYDWLENY